VDRRVFTSAVLVAISGGAFAQGFRSRLVRIVVPFSPGGGVDYVARLLANGLTNVAGIGTIVENRPGANTLIGRDAVATSRPDGNTLLLTSSLSFSSELANDTVNPNNYSRLAHIARLTLSPNLLVIRSNIGIKTFNDFLERGRPLKLSFGSSGIGSNQHFNGNRLAKRVGLDATHVPYKGGSQALFDLLGGRIDYIITSPSEVIPRLREGSCTALAQTGGARSKALPYVPTFEELGLGDGFRSSWYGLAVPTGTNQATISRLLNLFQQSLHFTLVEEGLNASAIDTAFLAGKDFELFLSEELASARENLKALLEN
jgi:tripartite-type tricarboxylate transporter receptor subunit TctC